MPEKKLVILGASGIAEIACEYFTHDSDFDVVGFAVERQYQEAETLAGLPVVALEEVGDHFEPAEHWAYAAVTYTQQNRLRARLAAEAKALGYRLASYISSRAFVWRNVKIGEHCFIFENNVVQPFVELGDNVLLWSGNHIGHHSRVGNHCFISSHVVISGHVTVGDHSFIGVNATVGNHLEIGADCWIGPHVVITADVPQKTMIKPPRMSDQRTGIPPYFRSPRER